MKYFYLTLLLILMGSNVYGIVDLECNGIFWRQISPSGNICYWHPVPGVCDEWGVSVITDPADSDVPTEFNDDV